MCGITGTFSNNSIKEIVLSQKHRGPDGWGLLFNGQVNYGTDYDAVPDTNGFALGHNLLSITGKQSQPIVNDNALVFNGEIYNYTGDSDSKFLFELLQDQGMGALDQLDGVYAFAYYDGNAVYLARDLMGVKPLYYTKDTFVSEAKYLPGCKAVLPGEVVKMDNTGVEVVARRFLKRPEKFTNDETALKNALIAAVEKRIVKKTSLLFSGGIDSTLLAVLLKDSCKLECITAGTENSSDVEFSVKVAEELGLNHKVVIVDEKTVEDTMPIVSKIIESTNYMKVSVALPFYLAAKECDTKTLFTGLGSEEIFAGYQRHVDAYAKGWEQANEEMWAGLVTTTERDLYRDDTVTMHNSVELRIPFYDIDVINKAMSIHPKLKYDGGLKKLILRKISRELGVPEEICARPKKAAQYGSGVEAVMRRIAKNKGYKSPAKFLEDHVQVS